MQGFLLDENGDIVIENGKIGLVSDNELKAQTIRTVLKTNKGEWFLNENEGINFYTIMGKGVTDEARLSQIKSALSQVDDSMQVTGFNSTDDTKKRTSLLSFTAVGNDGVPLNFVETFDEETNSDAAAKLALANSTLTGYRVASEKLARRIDGI